jgi:hypothetical protein
MTFRGWVASLSTGETIFEASPRDLQSGKVLLLPDPGLKGELSDWQRLLERCRKENVRITQMRLQRGGATVIAQANADGYCQAYETSMSHYGKGQRTVQGIGTVVYDYVFMTWMDDGGNVWHDVRPMKGMHVHTTMRSLRDLV